MMNCKGIGDRTPNVRIRERGYPTIKGIPPCPLPGKQTYISEINLPYTGQLGLKNFPKYFVLERASYGQARPITRLFSAMPGSAYEEMTTCLYAQKISDADLNTAGEKTIAYLEAESKETKH